MSAIDADAHVIECEATFDYIDPEYHDYKPRVMVQENGDAIAEESGGRPSQGESWVIDGRIQPKESDTGRGAAEGSRAITDIAARLAHMDALEIDIQVLYPTVFLRAWTNDPTVEYAICKAYNRWLADIRKAAPDRLRWVVMPPLLSMKRMEEELRFAKRNGAVGVFLRGIEYEKQLDTPYFFPLYELGEELDLAMCIHSGNGSLTHHGIYGGGGIALDKLPILSAFSQLLVSGIPARFPRLRWGFLEAGAQWLPYVLNDYGLRYRRRGARMPETLLADNNYYVACQVTDDLERIVPMAGDGQLVIGTDYGRGDTSTELHALRMMRDDRRVPTEVANRILDANARALYGL